MVRITRGLFLGTGLDFKQIWDSERIDARSLNQMYDNAAGMSTRTEFNLHMGSLFQLSTHGPLGLAVQTAPEHRHLYQGYFKCRSTLSVL